MTIDPPRRASCTTLKLVYMHKSNTFQVQPAVSSDCLKGFRAADSSLAAATNILNSIGQA